MAAADSRRSPLAARQTGLRPLAPYQCLSVAKPGIADVWPSPFSYLTGIPTTMARCITIIQRNPKARSSSVLSRCVCGRGRATPASQCGHCTPATAILTWRSSTWHGCDLIVCRRRAGADSPELLGRKMLSVFTHRTMPALVYRRPKQILRGRYLAHMPQRCTNQTFTKWVSTA